MSAGLRCSLCRNLVDAEDVFCANCGREVETGADAAARPVLEQGLAGFDCKGCGASMTFDAGARAMRCAFCGSTDLERQPGATGRVRPSHVIPFAVSREQAVQAFRGWLSRGLWRPRRLAAEARLTSMQAVFVPCWRFEGRTQTSWTADSSQTPPGARAAWCPLTGRWEGSFEDVLVLASGSLSEREIQGLEPFDFGQAQPYAPDLLGDVGVEDFGVSRRGARPAAHAGVRDLEASRVPARVPGRSRNVHVNVLTEDLTSTPVLLPVWINAYRWNERLFRFCVNGQSGEVVGQAPVSVVKVLGAVLLGLAVLAAVGALVFARR